MMFWRSASQHLVRTTSLPLTNALFWHQALAVRFGRLGPLPKCSNPPANRSTSRRQRLTPDSISTYAARALNTKRLTELARIAEAQSLARLTRHGELVAQRAQPLLQVGRAQVPLPPGAFLQATAAGEETLARLVVEHSGKAKRVADLFAGIGTFALRLAETMRVSAADSDAGMITALQRGASTTPGLKPVETQTRDLFRRPFMASELKAMDAVVFDPPRQGAEAQARELAKSAVPVVVAVSCDAATFSRDAKILIDGGYKLAAITPVDQFRYSHHVEIVAKFVR